MEVIIPAWGNYPGFKFAALAAATYSGCPVHVIGEASLGVGTFHPMGEFDTARMVRSALARTLGDHADYYATGIARWFVVRDCLRLKIVQLPIFVADWDVMIFSNLRQVLRPYRCYDYGACKDCYSGASTAPLFLTRFEPLDAFCDLVMSMIAHKAPSLVDANDMLLWQGMDKVYDWAWSDLSRVRNDAVFDHHMGHDQGKFKMRDGSKVIEWSGGKPYFITKFLGRRVRAHTVHCWGKFKNRENYLWERSRV